MTTGNIYDIIYISTKGGENMKETKEINVTNNLGFCELLTIVFIILKLTNVIAWSWWWVLAPIWIPVVILLVFVMLVAVFSR